MHAFACACACARVHVCMQVVELQAARAEHRDEHAQTAARVAQMETLLLDATQRAQVGVWVRVLCACRVCGGCSCLSLSVYGVIVCMLCLCVCVCVVVVVVAACVCCANIVYVAVVGMSRMWLLYVYIHRFACVWRLCEVSLSLCMYVCLNVCAFCVNVVCVSAVCTARRPEAGRGPVRRQRKRFRGGKAQGEMLGTCLAD